MTPPTGSPRSGRLGTLEVQGERRLVEMLRPELSAACLRGDEREGERVVHGRTLRFSFGPIGALAGWGRRLRELAGRAGGSRRAEYDAIGWLARHRFPVARAVATGRFVDRGVAIFDFLFVEPPPLGRPFEEALRAGSAEERAALLRELARLVERMHQRGFVHGNLLLHELSVVGDASAPAIHLGPPDRTRSRAHLLGPDADLAQLMLEGARLFSAEESAAFFRTYFAARVSRGLAPDRKRRLARVARLRRRLFAPEGRRALAAGRAALLEHWAPPEVGPSDAGGPGSPDSPGTANAPGDLRYRADAPTSALDPLL